jgi:molecular chaperone DnaK
VSAYTLSIDYGTTYSVGVVASEAGTEVLELSRSRYLPSLVLIDPEGELLVGGSAVNQAGLYPDRVCATPKREVGKPAILLGGEAVKVHRAIAAVLERLGEEAARRFGGAPPQRLVLTHPALWAEERLGVLREAARAARLGEPELVPEPVAAAAHYADGSLAEGATVAVYDLGGGTFDAAVLRRLAGGGFEVAGRPGGDPNLGGEDFDNELRELVEEHAARIDPESFEAAREADGAHRQWSAFRREVRQAKEALSEELKYPLAVPGVDDPVLVTRRELEALLEPHLRRTIEQLAATISDAGLAPNDLAAIYLTGGSSSIPMVSTLISQELGLTPQTWGDPKAVVALGAPQTEHSTHTEKGAASDGPEPGPAATAAAGTPESDEREPLDVESAPRRGDWRRTVRPTDGGARLAEQTYGHSVDGAFGCLVELIERRGLHLVNADRESRTVEAITGNSGITLNLRKSSWGERIYVWLDPVGDRSTVVQMESRFRMRAQLSGVDMHKRNFELILDGLWDALVPSLPSTRRADEAGFTTKGPDARRS